MPTNDVGITQILALILKKIKIGDFSKIKEDISVRKKIQKSIYILQLKEFGFDLGYQYNLYLAGPYSPALSESYYEIAEHANEYQNNLKGMSFKNGAEKAINNFINEFDNDYQYMECFATLHFLENYTFAYIKDIALKQRKAKSYLKLIKPEYNKHDSLIAKAQKRIRNHK